MEEHETKGKKIYQMGLMVNGELLPAAVIPPRKEPNKSQRAGLQEAGRRGGLAQNQVKALPDASQGPGDILTLITLLI